MKNPQKQSIGLPSRLVWKAHLFPKSPKIKVLNVFSASSPKRKRMQEQQSSICLNKTEGKKLDHILSGLFQPGLFYNFIQNKWANKKRKAVWWGKFCLGTQGEKSAFCCILASRHYKHNWCGWVQLLRVENTLRFCLLGFCQSVTGDSQRKCRKQVAAHKITKEPLDRQGQFIKHVSDSKLCNGSA